MSDPALAQTLTKAGLKFELEPDSLEKLFSFTRLLLSWNQKIHLVSKAQASPEGISRQIADSLLLLHHFEILHHSKILDLGSGAGFPAIPVSIVRDDLKLVLTESTVKKGKYLQDAKAKLKLENCAIFPGRAKDLRGSYNNHFDLAFSKASGKLTSNWEEVYPFLKRGGVLLTYKGSRCEEELEEAKESLDKFPGRVEEKKRYDLEELKLGGYLLLVRKGA